MLCFTDGEASALGPGSAGLRRIRAGEPAAAAAVLGMAGTTLPDYPGDGLASIPATTVAARVHQHVQLAHPDALLIFDEGGITGHRDHCQAAAAALSAAGQPGLPVIAWATPRHVAALLDAEFGMSFAGRPPEQIDAAITVEAPPGSRRSPVTPASPRTIRCCGTAWNCSANPSTCPTCAGQPTPESRRGPA